MKHLIALMLTITLAACGSSGGSGGGSSISNTETRNPTSENPLGRNLSIPSFSISRTGVQGSSAYDGDFYFKNPRVRTIHTGVNGEFKDLHYVEYPEIQKFGSNPFTASGNGILLDSCGDCGLIYIANNQHMVFGARGSNFISAPSGKHTYSGANMGISKKYGEWIGIGSFAMNVDFDKKSAYLKGSTTHGVGNQNWSSEIEGEFTINTNTGNYVGSDLKLSVGGTESRATISGNFHGRNARGVTGKYIGLGNNSNIEGGIVGSRDGVLSSADRIN